MYEWRIDQIVLQDGRHGLVCYFRDISTQVQARQTQQLLVDELNHRVKNMLASVQAIVQHTLRTTRSLDDFTASVTGRIQAMSRVHSLLSSGSWKGADLRDVIRDQILPGTMGETRLTAWGPPLHLEPQAAQHLAWSARARYQLDQIRCVFKIGRLRHGQLDSRGRHAPPAVESEADPRYQRP